MAARLLSAHHNYQVERPFFTTVSYTHLRAHETGRNLVFFSLTADLIFQFFVGEAWGERRIIFRKFKENQNFAFLLCLHVCCCLLLFAFVCFCWRH